MADFLLELRSEEIPARMQAKARNDLARMFAECTSEAGLKTGSIDTHSTPRRLVLIARDVAEATEAAREEVKGPRSSAPPQALEGFLRKTGLRQEQLEEREGVYFAVIERAGRRAPEILAEAIKRIVADFPWPKSMRWGDGTLRWVRPLHGIVAMLGEEIVPVEIDGVASGATTVGHRFHHPGAITIGGAADYIEKLRACHVIVDQNERERLIREGAETVAREAGLTLLADEGLVVENAGLTEWPVPLLGRFDAEYLDVPREVIVLTMRTNQKYFACASEEGLLAPAFVCVANIDANDGGASIVEGNRRVLAARLADARFFWEQDVKIPLEEQAKKLSGIVFHEKLGTVADKVERVAKLARWLVEEHVVTPAKAGAQHDKKLGSRFRGNDEEVAELADLAERAARLAKADLVTSMVGEFPELQGVIGGYLAEAQGEPREVADAIRDHYKPVGQEDEVPMAPATVAVALADKLDTLIGFFAIDEKPTGSKDPFALRRTGLGALSIIVANAISVSFRTLFERFYEPISWSIKKMFVREEIENWPFVFDKLWNAAKPSFEVTNSTHVIIKSDDQAVYAYVGQGGEDEILIIPTSASVYSSNTSFLVDRLKVQQREAGVRHDLIDAVFALGGEDDLVRLLARVKALQEFVETEDGADLLTAFKRAANMLKKEEGSWAPDQVRHDDFVAEENALITALDAAEPKASAAIEAEDFTAAMTALASIRAPIDAFFEKVTVNDPDAGKRARRLDLLARFRDAVNQVADFSKIEG
jgi:glycyl-tRNA synthetase beta chain